jgi:hypothetical protein
MYAFIEEKSHCDNVGNSHEPSRSIRPQQVGKEDSVKTENNHGNDKRQAAV